MWNSQPNQIMEIKFKKKVKTKNKLKIFLWQNGETNLFKTKTHNCCTIWKTRGIDF